MSGREGPTICVAVCTLGRSPLLGDTLQSLLDQRHSPDQLLVVDNEPSTGRVRRQVDAVLVARPDARIEVVAEPARGLSRARNRAVWSTSCDWIAFTDDDAVADPDWLAQLATVASHPGAADVACITGRVRPATTDGNSQRWFEQGFSFDKGPTPFLWRHPDPIGPDELRVLDPVAPGITEGPHGPVFPIAAGEFGSGNNMVVRTDWLRRSGGFDESLGAGSATRGGEDLDLFRRVVLDGRRLLYQPAAVVVHHHRQDPEDLRAQSYAYGTGMAASVTRYAMTSPAAALRALAGIPAALSLLLRSDSTKNVDKGADYPAHLDRAERLGYLAGPFLAVLATWQVRRDPTRHDRRRAVPTGGTGR
jgi:GT2 family glycosyltransferase